MFFVYKYAFAFFPSPKKTEKSFLDFPSGGGGELHLCDAFA